MKKFLLMLVLLLCCESEISAHGTGYRKINLKAVPLEFFYSTGEKMSYREVKVFSPKDQKFAVQSGRTDEEGRFAFIPDVSGDWRVIARDEEGHQCEAKIFIDDNSNSSTQNNSQPNLISNAILGVSLIFNIAAFVKLFRRNKKSNAH